MSRFRSLVPLVVIFFFILILGACNTATTPGPAPLPSSGPLVQMVPDPTDYSTSEFAPGTSASAAMTTFLDDAFVRVPFDLGFTFPFYGQTYDAVWINTNGGVTFGDGSAVHFKPVDTITVPGIGIFWGDLDPSMGDPANPDQIDYQQFNDRFVITYTQVPQWINPTVNPPPPTSYMSMTLTLYSSGTVTMSYVLQESNHGIVGVFDGSQAGYVNVALAPTYDNFSASTGTIVYDPDGPDPTDRPSYNTLNGTSITFNP